MSENQNKQNNNPLLNAASGIVRPKGSLLEEEEEFVNEPKNYPSFNIGNIKNEKFIDIWNQSLQKSIIKGNDVCKKCKHYKVCRGGCRARSLYLFGNLDEVDPLCPLKRNKS